MSANCSSGVCLLTQTSGCETSREFKNGPGLLAGSQAVVAMGRTRQTAVSWAGSARRTGDWVVCKYTGGPSSSDKELNDLV